MTNVYFTWFGGEGGDFLMGLLYLCLTGEQNFYINQHGQCMDATPEFTYNNFKFLKEHCVFTDKKFKQTKNKFVFYIKNPDRSLHLKKKLGKVSDFIISFPPPPKPFVKKMFTAFKSNDFQTVYYYLYLNFVTIHDRYQTSTQKALYQVPHQIIDSNLVTAHEIISALKIINDNCNLNISFTPKILSIIDHYVEKQQQYTNLDWPHLEY